MKVCRIGRSEARRRGIVVGCPDRGHRCEGRLVDYRWLATMENCSFISRQPHCGSCLSDQEYGYDDGPPCCCVHREEYDRRFDRAGEPAGGE